MEHVDLEIRRSKQWNHLIHQLDHLIQLVLLSLKNKNDDLCFI